MTYISIVNHWNWKKWNCYLNWNVQGFNIPVFLISRNWVYSRVTIRAIFSGLVFARILGASSGDPICPLHRFSKFSISGFISEKQLLCFKVRMQLQWLYVLREINVHFILMCFVSKMLGPRWRMHFTNAPCTRRTQILARTWQRKMAHVVTPGYSKNIILFVLTASSGSSFGEESWTSRI